MARVPVTTAQPVADAQPAFLTGDTRRSNPRPKGQNTPFILAHEQDAWDVSSGKVVPALARHIVQDGLNGASAIYDQAGRYAGLDTSTLRANLIGWGQREIPHDTDGPGTSYMVQPYPGHFVDRWTKLYEGSERRSYDQAGYDKWRAGLVTRKVILPPRLPALEALQQRLQAAHDGLADRVGSLPPATVTDATREMKRLSDAIKVVIKEADAAIEAEA